MFGVMSVETLNPKVSQTLWTQERLAHQQGEPKMLPQFKILVTVQVPLQRTVILCKCSPYSSKPKDP